MYDPLIENHPQAHQGYPDSFWARDLTAPPQPVLDGDIQSDIVIIGAGYTGLSAAYHLARTYAARVVVLEANEVGWGCSGRNAGFVLAGSGRLSLQQLIDRWDRDTAVSVYREFLDSVHSVSAMIARGKIDCDRIQAGYLKLAHTHAAADKLKRQAQQLQDLLGDEATYLSADEVKDRLIRPAQLAGAVYYPDYYAINPLKLAQGYASMARTQGADIYANSPVTEWQQQANQHVLRTPQGSVSASKVIIASNGYTGPQLHDSIRHRHFPVLSSVIVTPPLNDDQLAVLGMKPGLMAMDTRAMKYYYRLLPDNRLLFGGRGAIKGKDANHLFYRQQLLEGLKQTFPGVPELQAAYFWSGWVSVSYDDFPRVWQSDDQRISYAMGYCGSGVAFATQAGKRLAQHAAGHSVDPLPFWQSPLPRFPFARFRRLGLRAYYAWAKLTSV